MHQFEFGESLTGSFPTGLAVGSPGDLQTATLVAATDSRRGWRYAFDWVRGVWAGMRGEGRPADLARLATATLPMGSARAAAAMRPEIEALAEKIQRVLDGDTRHQHRPGHGA